MFTLEIQQCVELALYANKLPCKGLLYFYIQFDGFISLVSLNYNLNLTMLYIIQVDQLVVESTEVEFPLVDWLLVDSDVAQIDLQFGIWPLSRGLFMHIGIHDLWWVVDRFLVPLDPWSPSFLSVSSHSTASTAFTLFVLFLATFCSSFNSSLLDRLV